MAEAGNACQGGTRSAPAAAGDRGQMGRAWLPAALRLDETARSDNRPLMRTIDEHSLLPAHGLVLYAQVRTGLRLVRRHRDGGRHG